MLLNELMICGLVIKSFNYSSTYSLLTWYSGWQPRRKMVQLMLAAVVSWPWWKINKINNMFVWKYSWKRSLCQMQAFSLSKKVNMWRYNDADESTTRPKVLNNYYCARLSRDTKMQGSGLLAFSSCNIHFLHIHSPLKIPGKFTLFSTAVCSRIVWRLGGCCWWGDIINIMWDGAELCAGMATDWSPLHHIHTKSIAFHGSIKMVGWENDRRIFPAVASGGNNTTFTQ